MMLKSGTYNFRISSLGSSIEPVIRKDYWKCLASSVDLFANDKFLCQEIEKMEIYENTNNTLDIKMVYRGIKYKFILDTGDFSEMGGRKIESVKLQTVKTVKSNLYHHEYKIGDTKTRTFLKSHFKHNDNHTRYEIDIDATVNHFDHFCDYYFEIKLEKESQTKKIHFKYNKRCYTEDEYYCIDLGIKGNREGLYISVFLNMKTCGAYLPPDKTNFREIMCHDLGDDSQELKKSTQHTRMYAWGTKYIVSKEQFWNNAEGYYPDSPPIPFTKNNVWTESNNPCPTGFRVLTLEESKILIDMATNNPFLDSRIFKVNDWLYLHASENSNGIYNRRHITHDCCYEVRFDYFSSKFEKVKNNNIIGSVRCIKKLPNEL